MTMMNTVNNQSLVKIYEVNNCLIDLHLQEIAHDLQIHRPEPEVFATLIYLIEHRDHVVDLEEFRQQLWKDDEVSEFEIVRNIMKARQAILDDQSKTLIQYSPEKPGYRFVGDVLELEIN